MQDFKNLKVWQKAHQLTLAIYAITKRFPNEEQYGLMSQMRRASASIPTNLAEGCGRETNTEPARFAQIAMGSASELEYQLLLAHDLGFIEAAAYNSLNEHLLEVKRMLNSFIRTVRSTR